jgi:hypothetical protein
MHKWPMHAAHSKTDVDMPNSTSLTLIDRVRIHDSEAWERLVTLYTPFLHYQWPDSELEGLGFLV